MCHVLITTAYPPQFIPWTAHPSAATYCGSRCCFICLQHTWLPGTILFLSVIRFTGSKVCSFLLIGNTFEDGIRHVSFICPWEMVLWCTCSKCFSYINDFQDLIEFYVKDFFCYHSFHLCGLLGMVFVFLNLSKWWNSTIVMSSSLQIPSSMV